MITNIERPVHHRFAENIGTVSESVAENPKVWIPRRCQVLKLFTGILIRILYLDLYIAI